MIYSNPEFAVLLIATLVVFLLSPSHTARLWILLISSLIFYAWSSLGDTFIFLSVVFISWFATYLSEKLPAYRRGFLTFGIIVMTLHLFFWKYSMWLATNIQEVFPHFLGGHTYNLPLPLGISFFTLQGIAYLVDYGRDTTKYIPLLRYSVFKSFFGQLVAGPIVRANQLMPQINAMATPTWYDFQAGIGLFCIGFFKKIAFADWAAVIADPVFKDPSAFNRKTLIFALAAYALQIWADFSGYTDMGRGAARMFGIHLPENFLSPYLSRSPAEFWRRWHITLGTWIRDYIFTPLCFSPLPGNRILVSLFLTMSIAGIWHGANWTFLLFGMYWGVLLVVQSIIEGSRLGKSLRSRISPIAFAAGQLVTMWLLIGFAWLLFRAPDFGTVVSFLKTLGRGSGTGAVPIDFAFYWVSAGILFCALHHILSYRDLTKKNGHSILDRLRARIETLLLSLAPSHQENVARIAGFSAGIAAAISIVITIFVRSSGTSSGFIYFRF